MCAPFAGILSKFFRIRGAVLKQTHKDTCYDGSERKLHMSVVTAAAMCDIHNEKLTHLHEGSFREK